MSTAWLVHQHADIGEIRSAFNSPEEALAQAAEDYLHAARGHHVAVFTTVKKPVKVTDEETGETRVEQQETETKKVLFTGAQIAKRAQELQKQRAAEMKAAK